MMKEVNRSSHSDPGWRSDIGGKLSPTSRSRGLAVQQIKVSDLVSTVNCNLQKTICYVLSLCQHAVELPNPPTFSNNIYSMYVWLQRDKTDTILCSGRPEGASKYVQSTFCWNRHQRSAAFLSHQPLTHICVRQKKEQVTWSSTVKERIGR